MAISAYKSVKNRLLKYKRGRIIFPNTFKILGDSDLAIRLSLHRLEKQGLLVRLSHGIYLYPKKDKNIGILYPSIQDIAKAIAKRDKARLIPTGTQAMNILGLSTQVPLKVVYLTDSSPRKINVGGRIITFKRTNQKDFKTKGEISTLVIQAFKEIGKKNVRPEVLEKIKNILKKEQKENIIHDSKLAPVWISEILLKNKE